MCLPFLQQKKRGFGLGGFVPSPGVAMEGGAKDTLSQMGWEDLTHPRVPAHPSDSPSALVHSCFPLKRGMSLVDFAPIAALTWEEGRTGGMGVPYYVYLLHWKKTWTDQWVYLL